MKLGVALKVEDGAKRGAEPALLATLRAIDAIRAAELDRLQPYASPSIRNTRNEAVGSLRTRIEIG